MTGLLYRLGRLCVRFKYLVAALWLVLVVGVAVAGASAGTETNDNLSLPGTGSQSATDVLEDRFPEQANGTNPLVYEAPAGKKVTDEDIRRVADQVIDAYRADGEVNSAGSPYSSQGAGQLSKDETIAYVSLNLKPSPSELTADEAWRLIDVAKPLEDAGLRVAAGGYLGQTVSKADTGLSEAVGLMAAVVVLLFTFGTVVAMGLPIATAVGGLVAGLSGLALVSHLVDIPTAAPALATMIGLGVGIDYALFIVSRHRGQLQAGMPVDESIARAIATTGGAVVFAGGTVVIALSSLALAGLPIVTTLGFTAAGIVIVAVVAAMTLLPALLAILGARINALKLPGLRHHHDDRPHGWARWATWVADRPWPALVVSVLVLGLLCVPVFGMQLGQSNNGALPEDTQARQSYDLLSKGFGPGSTGPMLVAVELSKPATNDQASLDQLEDQQRKQEQQQQSQQQQSQQQAQQTGQPPPQPSQEEQDKQAQQQEDYEQQKAFLESPASDPRLQDLKKDMEKTDGVDAVTQPLVNDSGSAAVYTVTPTTAPGAQATTDTVNRLRDDTIPAATQGEDMTGYVGGTTAGYIDLADEIGHSLPLVIGIVLLLSFLVLLLAFRSLLVPLKAVLMNVLSIGAAFGVVTFVFSHDWTRELIGISAEQPIVSFVPLMMFAILFGLSMDYEVFLMTHVRERYRLERDPHAAVVGGLAATARVITSAALIMVSVFMAFVLSGDPTIKQFGIGMAAAVAIDATLIRCVLVPAIMALLGRSAWAMPRWLDRATPRISIEGEEYFAERDAAASPPEPPPAPPPPERPKAPVG